MAEPLVLIHGDEPHLVTDEALRLRRRLAEGLESEFELEEFRGPVDADSVFRSLATPPFLGPRRLVVLWDPLRPESRSRPGQGGQVEPGAQVRPADGAEAEAYAGDGPRGQAGLLARALAGRLETTAALLVVRSELRASSPLVRAVRDLGGELRALSRPRPGDLATYVSRAMTARRIRLGPAVRARLTDIAQESLAQLDQELEKLEIFAAGAEIKEADALALLTATPSSAIFRLTDTLFASPARTGPVLTELRSRAGSTTQGMMGWLARVFRDLLSFADPAETQRWDGVQGRRRQALEDQLRRAGVERIQRWLVELADLDWASRNRGLDADDGLELFLAGAAGDLLGVRS